MTSYQVEPKANVGVAVSWLGDANGSGPGVRGGRGSWRTCSSCTRHWKQARWRRHMPRSGRQGGSLRSRLLVAAFSRSGRPGGVRYAAGRTGCTPRHCGWAVRQVPRRTPVFDGCGDVVPVRLSILCWCTAHCSRPRLCLAEASATLSWRRPARAASCRRSWCSGTL